MEWINTNYQLTPKDVCPFNLCWTNDSSGSCGFQFCGKRYCVIRF